MRKILAVSSVCAMAAMVGTVAAQDATLPAPGPPIVQPGTNPYGAQGPISQAQVPLTPAPVQAPLPPGQLQNSPPQAMYPLRTANIRAGAGTGYTVIGKVAVGQPVQVVGELPNGWFQLASGGYVSASVLSPTPLAAPVHHHRPLVVPPPSTAYYPVGACEPYSRVVNIGGQPSQINGTACKQPDGTWRIENYGVPVPVIAPAPPAVAGPPPVVVVPPPVVYGPPIVYEHRHDPYWRY